MTLPSAFAARPFVAIFERSGIGEIKKSPEQSSQFLFFLILSFSCPILSCPCPVLSFPLFLCSPTQKVSPPSFSLQIFLHKKKRCICWLLQWLFVILLARPWFHSGSVGKKISVICPLRFCWSEPWWEKSISFKQAKEKEGKKKENQT